LASLAKNVDNRVLIAQEDGIEAVVIAMGAHSSHDDVQHQGCAALMNIAYKNYDGKVRVADRAGVIEAVVAAMHTLSSSVDVQEKGCGALMHIVNHADNAQLVSKAGGIEVVVIAMRTHLSSIDVQLHGCGALTNIAWNAGPTRKRVIDAGGREVAKTALERYPTHDGVQTWGKWLLEKLV